MVACGMRTAVACASASCRGGRGCTHPPRSENPDGVVYPSMDSIRPLSQNGYRAALYMMAMGFSKQNAKQGTSPKSHTRSGADV
jgi:hypothetical protein